MRLIPATIANVSLSGGLRTDPMASKLYAGAFPVVAERRA
jgi:hypothetical protein